MKLLKTKASIWFNEMFRLNHLTPKYINFAVIEYIINIVVYFAGYLYYVRDLANARRMNVLK